MMRKILFAAASCAAALVLGTGVASAGGKYADLGPMTVVPDSGPAGTTFEVSGSGCDYGEIAGSAAKANGSFSVALWFEAGDQNAEAPVTGGSWSHEFTVPDGTPVGPYDITGSCYYGGYPVEDSASKGIGYEQKIGEYDDGVFTVTEPPTTTTEPPTTTEAPTTTVAEAPTTTTEAPVTTLGTAAPTTAAPTTSATVAAAAAELPRTGVDPTPLLAIGGASVTGGLAALAARRRTRR